MFAPTSKYFEAVVVWAEIHHHLKTPVEEIMGPFVARDADVALLRRIVAELWSRYRVLAPLKSSDDFVAHVYAMRKQSILWFSEIDEEAVTIRWFYETGNEEVVSAVKAATGASLSLYTVQQLALEGLAKPIVIPDSEVEDVIAPLLVAIEREVGLGDNFRTIVRREDAIEFARSLVPEDVPGQRHTLDRLCENRIKHKNGQETSEMADVERDILFAMTKEVDDTLIGLVTVRTVIVHVHDRINPEEICAEL